MVRKLSAAAAAASIFWAGVSARAHQPPTPSPQIPTQADTAAPPPPAVKTMPAPASAPPSQTVTLHVQPAPQPVTAQPVQLQIAAVAAPVPPPQPQVITLHVVPTAPAPAPVAAPPVAAETAPSPATPAHLKHPGLFGRAVGAIGERLSRAGMDRIYLPRTSDPATTVAVQVAPAPVVQTQYVVRNPSKVQAVIVPEPTRGYPLQEAVTATPQTAPRKGFFSGH
jgi:hypothetical protein